MSRTCIALQSSWLKAISSKVEQNLSSRRLLMALSQILVALALSIVALLVAVAALAIFSKAKAGLHVQMRESEEVNKL